MYKRESVEFLKHMGIGGLFTIFRVQRNLNRQVSLFRLFGQSLICLSPNNKSVNYNKERQIDGLLKFFENTLKLKRDTLPF